MSRSAPSRTLVLFNYDWDLAGFGRWASEFPIDSAGFDLFSFPSNARLAFFDLDRYVERLARKAARAGWRAVTSSQEQFGALAAALLAERMGWPGTPVDAVLACQHKLHARGVMQDVCPQANTPFAALAARYGDPAPAGLDYPLFVKPVKAAFSVLARTVASREELHALTRFGAGELWVIRHLVEPFERIARARLPEAGTAHRMLIEQPAAGRQYNLDGYVFDGRLQEIGIVESVMYPGTHAFMRFDYPCRIAPEARQQALDVARGFLAAVGFTHGLFNMEFFFDAASGKLTVIEFNPRMAAQFSDLYLPGGRAGSAPPGTRACAWARPRRSPTQRAHGRGRREFRLPRLRSGAQAGNADPGTAAGIRAALCRWPAVRLSQVAGLDCPRLQVARQLPLRHHASGRTRWPRSAPTLRGGERSARLAGALCRPPAERAGRARHAHACRRMQIGGQQPQRAEAPSRAN